MVWCLSKSLMILQEEERRSFYSTRVSLPVNHTRVSTKHLQHLQHSEMLLLCACT